MPKRTGILFEDDDVTLDRRVMENGEQRDRTVASGGSSYIRTTAALGEPVWQNAHYHKHTSEFYVVVTGWMAVAERHDGRDYVTVFWPGQTYMSRPGVHHNSLIKPGADIDTLKYRVSQLREGDKESDWHEADVDFNRWTKGLTLPKVARLSATSLVDLKK